MSGEKHGADWSGSLPGEPASCRCGYNGTPEECAQSRTPVPSEVAETTAGEREVEALADLLMDGADLADGFGYDDMTSTEERRRGCVWIAELVLDSDWLAALLDRVRREEGAKVPREAADTFAWAGDDGDYRAFRDWLNSRAASVGRGEGL